MKPGEPFNPHGVFVGGFIPNAIMQYSGLSPIAKLTWARLQQYAGENGMCYPSYEKLAGELGIKRRHAMSTVRELLDKGFLTIIKAGAGRNRTNHYTFLWHECFENANLRKGAPECIIINHSTSQHGQETVHQNVPFIRNGAPECQETVHQNAGNGVLSCQKMVHQDVPKDIIQNKRENTTTTPEPEHSERANGSCGGSACGATSEREQDDGLSPEQRKYIELKVLHTEVHGSFTKGASAYRRALYASARKGKLELDDFDELLEWEAQRTAWNKQDSDSYDVPTATGDEQRRFVIGYVQENWTGAELITHLRQFIDSSSNLGDVPHHCAIRIIKEQWPEYYADADGQAVKDLFKSFKRRAAN